jgi:8-oxo-dGTP pyrophosphatase MutT (NUDIX family)
MSKFILNVEAVVWRQGRILMIERGAAMAYGAGWLSFPGGKVDWAGDEPDILERTAARELHEEVGIRLDGPWHFVESKSFGGVTDPVVDVVMIANAANGSGEPFIHAPEEVASIAWMTTDEILADPRTQPWTAESLRRAQIFLDRAGW